MHYKQVYKGLKKLRKAINTLIWTLASVYLILVVLLHIPAVRIICGNEAGMLISQKLGTKAKIESVDLGMLNRIILNNVDIEDQKGKHMLHVHRMAVRISLWKLIDSRISISAAQLFSADICLYKENAKAKPNFQFVLDSLASKEPKKESKLNVEVSSLIIRRTNVSYNQLDDHSRSLLSAKHINLSGVSAHIILNKLTNDSLNLNVKRLAFKDKSGLDIRDLKFKIQGSSRMAHVENLELELPNSVLSIPQVTASFMLENRKLKTGSLKYYGSIVNSHITPSDLACIFPKTVKYSKPIYISLQAEGTDKRISVSNLLLNQTDEYTLSVQKGYYSFSKDKSWAIVAKATAKSIKNFSNIQVNASAHGNKEEIHLDGKISSDQGGVTLKGEKVRKLAELEAEFKNADMEKITGNKDLGNLSCKVHARAMLSEKWKPVSGSAKAEIASLTFKGHTYRDVDANVNIDANLNANLDLDVRDAYGDITLNGNYKKATNAANFKLKVTDFNPYALGLVSGVKDNSYSLSAEGKIHGKTLADLSGKISLENILVYSPKGIYIMNECLLERKISDEGYQQILLTSDAGNIRAEGRFDFKTLAGSLTNALVQHVPTIPGLKSSKSSNSLKLYATVNDTRWADYFLGIPLQLKEPANIIADINDAHHSLSVRLDALDFTYDGKQYKDSYLSITSDEEAMAAHGNVKVQGSGIKGKDSKYSFVAKASDSKIGTSLKFDINGLHHLQGELNAQGSFFADEDAKPTADISILSSKILLGDSTWYVRPASICYKDKFLSIDNLSIDNGQQFVNISGYSSGDSSHEQLSGLNGLEGLTIGLKDVDVAYIMDLINFHSVDFEGLASGEAHVKNLFDNPDLDAHLIVTGFKFEHGRFGTLDANANYNIEQGDINIDAVAIDGDYGTVIQGYVSPKRNYIDLGVNTKGTDLDFLKKYASSFADNIKLRSWGKIDVVGPLSHIQLVGDADVSGSFRISALNVPFKVEKQHVHLIPNDIQIKNMLVTDTLGNEGVAKASIHHHELSNWGFDVDVNAREMLCYNTGTSSSSGGESNFWGKVFATGRCNISDKTGDVVISVDATPCRGTEFVYDASTPDAVSKQEFISWGNEKTKELKNEKIAGSAKGAIEDRGNLYMKFLIHATPEAEIKVVMSHSSNDYITLRGDGTIRATYYNKGSFDMFGNYTVKSGIYNLTIQQFIERRFEFQTGGTISFGGDAYNAPLNLQAKYTIPSVSLSDLNIGKSFSNNNVRADCLMNISGTPAQPKVDFALNLPTISSDAKQMVMSLMNSEEEVNQQVIYLLSIGRFLVQRTNNAATDDAAAQSQTSLAMQSILSGTVSQQLSKVLNTVVKSNKWNLGANISTGNDGWNNAEYEGLVSGRMFNNRLLFNGTFGYRDNLNKAQSTFIGDFDIQYLLRPDGNIAIRGYNQTNDRYFTKNSLTTQGIGLILKRDFDSWLDLFRKKKK